MMQSTASSFGSSPRLRGTRLALVAGSVHPRACGEHLIVSGEQDFSDGSSPRLRGTQDALDVLVTHLRFIPAPAGNTPTMAVLYPERPVHPRACGEHSNSSVNMDSSSGSSPRLRGTHPERSANRRLVTVSSPRLRGTPPLDAERSVIVRFIPAPAGNTSAPMCAAGCSTVHPRACGEHSTTTPHGSLVSGSSPRLRGTHSGRAADADCRRFIPAPAGNTLPVRYC